MKEYRKIHGSAILSSHSPTHLWRYVCVCVYAYLAYQCHFSTYDPNRTNHKSHGNKGPMENQKSREALICNGIMEIMAAKILWPWYIGKGNGTMKIYNGKDTGKLVEIISSCYFKRQY